MQPPLGVEHVGEPEQVGLVGAAAVVEDEQARRLARGRALPVVERRHVESVPREWRSRGATGRPVLLRPRQMTGDDAIHATEPTKTAAPRQSSTIRIRRDGSFALIPAKKSAAAKRTTPST